MTADQPPSLFEVDDDSRPLADRLRPASLGAVVGQEHLLGRTGPLGRMVEQQQLELSGSSTVLVEWMCTRLV
jgi:putative ATPase